MCPPAGGSVAGSLRTSLRDNRMTRHAQPVRPCAVHARPCLLPRGMRAAGRFVSTVTAGRRSGRDALREPGSTRTPERVDPGLVPTKLSTSTGPTMPRSSTGTRKPPLASSTSTPTSTSSYWSKPLRSRNRPASKREADSGAVTLRWRGRQSCQSRLSHQPDEREQLEPLSDERPTKAELPVVLRDLRSRVVD